MIADASAAGVEWLLLMRHAKADATGLTDTGAKQAAEVGEALADVLDDLQEARRPLQIVRIHAQATPQARATASAVRQELAKRTDPEELPAVLSDAPPVSPHADPGAVRAWAEHSARLLKGATDDGAGRGGTAVLLVGHDPGIGWLLDALLGNRRFSPGPPVPGIAHTEVVALRRHRKRWRPQWALTPSDDSIIAELTAKIESKMSTAKAFGAVLTALLLFVAREFADGPQVAPWTVWQAVAVSGFGLSIVLYLVALFFYDSLLLPRRFWQAGFPARAARRAPPVLLRPPASAAWVLFQNMLRVWNRLFVPATVAAGIAVAASVVALVQPRGSYGIGGIVVSAALAVVVAAWGWWSRPVLGARD